MEISNYINHHKYLVAAGICCGLLIIIRFFISFELYYLFLIWNLFLAGVPFVLSQILKSGNAKIISFLLLGIWLLFLPNSFYVITDLIHLRYSQFQVYDTVMISSFALLCTSLGFMSMRNVKLYVDNFFPKEDSWILNISIFFLCSFGIYLGRFLRYNSWNILSNPLNLATDCLKFVIFPIHHYEVWVFTFSFGLMLTGLYFIFIKITEKDAV